MNSLVMGPDDIGLDPTPKPDRLLLYAVNGFGKSTFGANAYKPIFACAEDGLSKIRVPHFPKEGTLRSIDHLYELFSYLLNEQHDFRTVVIDTIDALERLVWKRVCAEHGNVSGLEDLAYGKGYSFAIDVWSEILAGLDALRDKGIMPLLLAHSKIQRIEDPMLPPYDRHYLNVHEGKNVSAAKTICDWCDHCFFGNLRTTLTQDKNARTARAVGSGERVMYTEPRPSFYAKHRGEMPFDIPLAKDGSTWSKLYEYFGAVSGVKNDAPVNQ
jgi:hypothetical protein